jgi:hypothetical protein
VRDATAQRRQHDRVIAADQERQRRPPDPRHLGLHQIAHQTRVSGGIATLPPSRAVSGEHVTSWKVWNVCTNALCDAW